MKFQTLRLFLLLVVSFGAFLPNRAIWGASNPEAQGVPLRLLSVRADKKLNLNWSVDASWQFRMEQGNPSLGIRFTANLPKDVYLSGIKSQNPAGTKVQLSQDGRKLVGYLIAKETTLTLTQPKVPEWNLVITVQPLTNPLVIDRSCPRMGVTFERPPKSDSENPSGDFAGAYCSKEKNLVKLVVSTGKDVDWGGSSLFEHEGKGERWKVFKVDVEAVASGESETGAGSIAWASGPARKEYNLVISSSGTIGKGIREAVRAEVGLAWTRYVVEKASRGQASVTGITAPIVVYVSPWKGRFNLLVRWLGTITSIPQNAQNSVSQWAVGAGYEIGKGFLIMPSVEYIGALFSSHELTVSTTFQGPGAKLLFVFNLFKGNPTMIGGGYASGAEAETKATLSEGILKQNMSLFGRTFSMGARYQQQTVSLTSGNINTTLTSVELGTQF